LLPPAARNAAFLGQFAPEQYLLLIGLPQSSPKGPPHPLRFSLSLRSLLSLSSLYFRLQRRRRRAKPRNVNWRREALQNETRGMKRRREAVQRNKETKQWWLPRRVCRATEAAVLPVPWPRSLFLCVAFPVVLTRFKRRIRLDLSRTQRSMSLRRCSRRGCPGPAPSTAANYSARTAAFTTNRGGCGDCSEGGQL
jgi:hypothetical protein